jgi:hypothetical protein
MLRTRNDWSRILVMAIVLSTLSGFLGPPARRAGRLHVGAATMAPVGANVMSLSIMAERCTISRQRPV